MSLILGWFSHGDAFLAVTSVVLGGIILGAFRVERLELLSRLRKISPLSSGTTLERLHRIVASCLKRSKEAQLCLVLCVIALVGMRVTNLFLPVYQKDIVDSLVPGEKPYSDCQKLILVYIGIMTLKDLFGKVNSFLWGRVKHGLAKEVNLTLFSHVHNLSLRWHLERDTGDIIRAMDSGVWSTTYMLRSLIFDILPCFSDVAIAIYYFSTTFDHLFGIIMLLTVVIYVVFIARMSGRSNKNWNKVFSSGREQRRINMDSLLNYQTIKLYGTEPFELRRFEEAISKHNSQRIKASTASLTFDMGRDLLFNGGLLAGSLYCGFLVSEGKLTVGDYALFGSYAGQLLGPITNLAISYNDLQERFADMRSMLDLMDEQPEIRDAPNSQPLSISQGDIEFRNVTFSYNPKRTILKNLSFTAKAGQTIALVGPTGAGKSTIIQLLFRFYDAQEGEILINGQNIKCVTQSSLRKIIGVVPQDTVLFKDTIKYNIRYARSTATDKEVELAATSAEIHDKILSFPDQYDSKVGERGLKLSGGEKQRVAIARTLLKNPSIVLLDEATSALDSQTEKNIQKALKAACQNRTTLIVAHRLSTITHSDTILVIDGGEIKERGRHEDLLKLKGQYYEMWNQQQAQKEN